MSHVGGVDVGSTYTKVVLLDHEGDIVGRAMRPTGFKLGEAAQKA